MHCCACSDNRNSNLTSVILLKLLKTTPTEFKHFSGDHACTRTPSQTFLAPYNALRF